ncbi:MAG: response regulator [Deltaproteobacteria bacterium]|nr:response regulator [Deltaproteobacteria bacterium]
MAEKMSWCERFSKYPFFLKGYGSILGLKIAVTACIFMVLPTLFYLFYHEYRREGAEEFLAVLTYTPFWLINIGLFAAFMVLLSKIVILPLKRFERHISELEKGSKNGPFELKRFDEIGYLVSRFNRLHRLTAEKIESKDIQLDVLHDFTKATSGVTDIPALMDNFFTTLRTAIDFDLGAYMVCHDNHVEGRIYSSVGGLDEASVEGISAELSSFQRQCCQGFGKDKTHRLQVSVLDTKPVHSTDNREKETRIDLPVTCFGKTVGMASIILRSDKERDKAVCSRVFGAMVQHAGIVMEKLLAHISAEEKKLSNILSSMSEGVYLIDKDGYATSVNKKGMELVGNFCLDVKECVKSGFYPNHGKCHASSREPCEFSCLLDRVRKHGCALDGKVHTEEIRSKDGQVLQLSISRLATGSDSNAGYVITVKDVTEDRLIQKRVMLSSKLAALGEMAAGIAHEVNNPLQVMLVNIELLDDELSERGSKRVEHIKDGIFRIKGIVRDLLIFAREQTTHVEILEINTALEKAVDIMRHQLKQSNVGIELDLDKQPLLVKCNKNLFQQVIINLLQNSKDAIEESARGSRVSIRTGSVNGESVFVEVSDDGPGIPEKILDRIFDPFFTTKDVGKGTGLGLSLSRRIIEGMGGTIAVESPKGRGTRFLITLSLRLNTPAETQPSAVLPDYGRLAGKSIIIVDDEKELGRAIKDGIGPKVASIECVHDGVTAFDRVMDRDYDIILLDIKMPGMNGVELYRDIKQNKPYLAQNIIFLTGDTVTEETESFIKLTRCASLSKPFTLDELLKAMSEYEQEAGV